MQDTLVQHPVQSSQPPSPLFDWAEEWGLPTQVLDCARAAEWSTEQARAAVRHTTQRNQMKVMRAFLDTGWGDGHFFPTTGYGYNDSGREALDATLARIVGAEAAAVRAQLVSGTHALSALLFGAMRPGQVLLAVTGDPYDTLKPVLQGARGSLEDWGVGYRAVPLRADGSPDVAAAVEAVADPKVTMAYIQRSRGYDWRPSLGLEAMASLIAALKTARPDVAVLVDNCYGELVEELEPTQLGADCMAGSLIKNLGGTLAPTGGYVAGRADLVEAALTVATAPGICGHQGATLGLNRILAQGLWNAPGVVGQALEGAVWAAALFEALGFEVSPRPGERRTDIIQSLRLGSARRLQAFCRGVQSAGPMDARAVPQPVMNPGYRDPIVMAGGTFIQGSSMELSADGPLREPYAVYLQGGTSYLHVQLGVLGALRALHEEGLLP